MWFEVMNKDQNSKIGAQMHTDFAEIFSACMYIVDRYDQGQLSDSLLSDIT
jgi:hypothetical protein